MSTTRKTKPTKKVAANKKTTNTKTKAKTASAKLDKKNAKTTVKQVVKIKKRNQVQIPS